MICRGVPEAAIGMMKFAAALCAGELESVTLMANEYVPAVIGVPLIWPEEFSVSPAGKDPELADQLYGVFPPVAASVAE